MDDPSNLSQYTVFPPEVGAQVTISTANSSRDEEMPSITNSLKGKEKSCVTEGIKRIQPDKNVCTSVKFPLSNQMGELSRMGMNDDFLFGVP